MAGASLSSRGCGRLYPGPWPVKHRGWRAAGLCSGRTPSRHGASNTLERWLNGRLLPAYSRARLLSCTILTDIDKITVMPSPPRITGPLLDVSECLLRARGQGRTVHGWALMKQTRRSGPTVYGVLDRLEDCGWITGWWEDLGPEESRPRRRLYRLTPEGAAGIRALLEQRRPQVLRSLESRSPGGVVPRLAPGGAL